MSSWSAHNNSFIKGAKVSKVSDDVFKSAANLMAKQYETKETKKIDTATEYNEVAIKDVTGSEIL